MPKATLLGRAVIREELKESTMKYKRFTFATISIICVSVTTVIMSYPPDLYKFIVLAIVGGYLGAQSFSDTKNSK